MDERQLTCRKDDINPLRTVVSCRSHGAEVSGRRVSAGGGVFLCAEEFNVAVINCQSLGSARSALSQLDTLIILTGQELTALSQSWKPDTQSQLATH